MENGLKIFIINLPRSLERRKYMEDLCKDMRINPIFIEGIDGKELSINDLLKNTDQDKAKKFIGRELMLGEIGCALSHKKIFTFMVENNIAEALVLEDDVYFEPWLHEALSILNQVPINADLILLGHHAGDGSKSVLSFWGRQKINKTFTICRLGDFGFGTYGYFIKKKGASKLLTALNSIYRPIDHYTSDSNILNVYTLEPRSIMFNKEVETLIDTNSRREEKYTNNFREFLKSIKLFPLISKINKIRKQLKPIKKY